MKLKELNKSEIKNCLKCKPSYRELKTYDGKVFFAPFIGRHTFQLGETKGYNSPEEAIKAAKLVKQQLEKML